jgi:hypothetical protein
MTRAADKTAGEGKPARAKTRPPGRRKLLAGAVLLCCIAAGGALLLSPKSLPPAVRNNPAVESLYRGRDKALHALTTGGAAALDGSAAALEHGADALERHADKLQDTTPASGGETQNSAGAQTPADKPPGGKQVGYRRGDRDELDKLISTGADAPKGDSQ